jgi:serine/threonine protein phosphatase PrpC
MQEQCISSSLQLLDKRGPTRLHLQWASLNGSALRGRRNEDGLLVMAHEHDLLLGVFDGVSPLATAKVRNGGYFASKHAIMGICESFEQGERDLVALLLSGNDSVRKISLELRLNMSDYAELVACTATVALLNFASRTIHYAHVGDSALALKPFGEGWTKLTSDKVEQFESRAISQAFAANPTNPAQAFKDPKGSASQTLRENRGYQNAPGGGGYGVLNGHDNQRLAPYIETSKQPISLDSVESLVLFTDGAMLTGEGHEGGAAGQPLHTLFERGPEAYLKQVRAAERGDSQLRKHPRVKLHDDATIIMLHSRPDPVER